MALHEIAVLKDLSDSLAVDIRHTQKRKITLLVTKPNDRYGDSHMLHILRPIISLSKV